MELTVAAHPLLEVGAFVMRFEQPLAQLATPHEIVQLIEPSASAPLVSSDTVRTEVRNLLRHGGFRPSGRSKPAAEYISTPRTRKAASRGSTPQSMRATSPRCGRVCRSASSTLTSCNTR